MGTIRGLMKVGAGITRLRVLLVEVDFGCAGSDCGDRDIRRTVGTYADTSVWHDMNVGTVAKAL
jgi:hypothetical protein